MRPASSTSGLGLGGRTGGSRWPTRARFPLIAMSSIYLRPR